MSQEHEVKGLYKIIDLIKFRETPGVRFDILPKSILEGTAGVDRVIHDSFAISPGPSGCGDGSYVKRNRLCIQPSKKARRRFDECIFG
ncbi:MAG: hypothetical protein ACVCEJ_03120 [Candidatus Izemoplasmataceae bacterium]